MDVVFNSTTEKVVISSTNKMGTRPMGYITSNSLNSPFHNALHNQLFPQAYAGERFNRFLGQVKMHRQAVTYALVETVKWSALATIGFSNGVIYGDTSTTAGIIGDIALGFLPFGDARDIAIQEYYFYYNTLDNNGKPKYDETILYLAYIGLGADVLMLSPAAPLGAALNGVVAGTKTGMKLLDKLPGKKVLAQRFKEMAEAARDRDWTRFEAITRNTLPFMQLFAAVALDEDLRNLLGSAIRNTADLDNWAKYLKGYADQPDTVAHVSPLPKGLFDEAYAATSPFKLILQKMVRYGAEHGVDDLGPVLSDSIGTLRRAIDSDTAIAKYAYKEEAIQAMVNIHKLGGTSALEKLAKFKHISTGVSGGTIVGDQRIEKMMKNFAELDLSKLPIGKDSGEGFTRILGDLVRSDNFAKGAAHAVNVLKRIQKSEVDELKDLGALTHIEKYRHSKVNGGVEIRSGREDFIFGDTILELKSYNTENLRSQLVRDMKGKDNGQKGLQLFSNVLEMAEGKDIRMVFEKFDGLDAELVRTTLEDVVTNALKNDKNLRDHISGWYDIDNPKELGVRVDEILSVFKSKLASNVLVVD